MPPKRCCCCPECDDGKKYRDKNGKCCGCCGPVGQNKAITTNNYELCNCCCDGQIVERDANGNCPPCGDCPPCTDENRCQDGSCPTDRGGVECECPCDDKRCWDGTFPTEPDCICPPQPCPQCSGGTSPSEMYFTLPTPKCGSSGFDGQPPVDGECTALAGLSCTQQGSFQKHKACSDHGGVYTLKTGGSTCWSIWNTHCWTQAQWTEHSAWVPMALPPQNPFDLQQQWLTQHTIPANIIQGSSDCWPMTVSCTSWTYESAPCVTANASPFGNPSRDSCPPSGCPVCGLAFCAPNPPACPDAWCESTRVNMNNYYGCGPLSPLTIRASITWGTFGGVVGWGYVVTVDRLGTWMSKHPIGVDSNGKPVCGEPSPLELVIGQCSAEWQAGCCYQSTADTDITSIPSNPQP